MSGEYRIEAPRQKVWEALNDPAVLKACIPGCESLEKSADNQFDATVRAKVGPVSAKFNGSVTLSDIVEAESYTISGTGKGGAAGMASGSAKVHLADAEGGATTLAYEVEAKVSGKIAQIGARLIDSTAKKYADEFFAKFREILEGEGAAPSTPAATPAATAPAAAPEPAPAPAPAPPPRPDLEAAPLA
ncbi:MAG: carbon monoxide dehydrogenase subunit G, partial [Tistlia sp.]